LYIFLKPTRAGPPGWGLGEVLTTPSREKKPCFVLLTIGLFYLDEMLPLEIKHSPCRKKLRAD
jgi:hypothetical protein